MNFNTYKIVFASGMTEIVYTHCHVAAIILAQAKQINKGNDFVVKEKFIERKRGFPSQPIWEKIP